MAMDPTAEWKKLLSEDPDLDELEELIAELADDDPAYSGAPLTPIGDGVFRALLIVEDGSARERLLRPFGDLVTRALEATETDSPIEGLGLVRGAALLWGAGIGDDAGPALERWLPAALAPDAYLPDQERTSYALACAAMGYDDAVFELVGERPLAFAPGATFGPDARTFARYLVAAVAEGASSNDVSAAWTSFVAFLPVRVETGGLRWTDLLFGGLGAYQRVAGFPAGQVVDLIREFARELAAA
jgi:hypothetical protein